MIQVHFLLITECVKNRIIKKLNNLWSKWMWKKSNFRFCNFDLISQLTDKETEPNYYKNYLNADSSEK